MKNSLRALALTVFTLGVAQAQTAPTSPLGSDLSVRANFTWASKNVARGKERSSDEGLFQSQLTLDFAVPSSIGTSIYTSVYTADSFEQVFGLGLRRNMECGTLDIGYQHTTANNHFVNTNNVAGYTLAPSDNEYYLGFILPKDVFLRPSAYVFYSDELRQYNFVVSARKDFDGAEIGLSGFNIVTKLYAGSIYASESNWDSANSYLYAGASADFVYAINPNASVGTGLNFAYNNDHAVDTQGGVFWYRFFANFRF
jgi:hypothetical protein